MSALAFPVYEMRPDDAGGDNWWRGPWLRYADGNWTPDDGAFDVAWISTSGPLAVYVNLPYQTNLRWSWTDGHWTENCAKHPRSNPWHYMLSSGKRFKPWAARESHPNVLAGRKAMDECCGRFRCANGRGPEFHIGDEHIAKGLVRERESGHVVTFPDTLVCCYCGPVDWPKRFERVRELRIEPA